MLGRLAALASRFPKRVVAVAVVFALVAAALGGNVASRLGPYSADDPASESSRVSSQLTAATGLETTDNVVVLVTPVSQQKVGQVAHVLDADPSIGHVASWYSTHDRAMRSRDGKSTYVVGSFRDGAS